MRSLETKHTYRIKKLNDSTMRDFTIAIANHLVRFRWNHQDRTLICITDDEEAAAAAQMRPEKYLVEEIPAEKKKTNPITDDEEAAVAAQMRSEKHLVEEIPAEKKKTNPLEKTAKKTKRNPNEEEVD